MQIGIIGTGYVGLVTGACFAELGLTVVCVDNDRKKIDSLRKGRVPFYEPGLEDLVKKHSDSGRLRFSIKISDAVGESSVIMIAVGTPPKRDGSADLVFVEAVTADIAAHMTDYKVIVTKSTVPVGTGDRLKKIISDNLKTAVEFDIVSNPEFLREGSAIEDFMKPDRIVIGAESERAIEIMKDLYRPLYLLETPVLITSVKSAEMIKYASNCYLATKISFINEVANLCDRIGADVHDVARGMGLDPRIGSRFLHPGPGFGGSCLPKDTKALVRIAVEQNTEMKVLQATVEANQAQYDMAFKKIRDAVGTLKGSKITVLGLSFKPDTDDIREAPALYLIDGLMKGKAEVRAHDPLAMKNTKEVFKDVLYFKDPYSAIKGADALVIVTEWKEFRNLDLEKVKALMRKPCFIDLRNIYDAANMRAMGFEYFCIGRPVT